MKSQGEAIRHVIQELGTAGWTVVFYSMPNTAHSGVVPIPTVLPGARQRYPDVVATKGGLLLLAEIEPRLTSQVELEIQSRFLDHDAALQDQAIWHSWRSRVAAVTGLPMPDYFVPRHQLVVCQRVPHRIEPEMEIIAADDYAAPAL
jgi:hypothetical protein